jgi:hypothetical protein
MKWASQPVEKRLGMARLTFSSVMSSCHVHASVLAGSGDIVMSSSGAIGGGPLGSVVKSVTGEQPRNGSGCAIRDFFLCANAFLVVRLWNDPRSCQATQYVSGSIVEKRLGRVMASASGSA